MSFPRVHWDIRSGVATFELPDGTRTKERLPERLRQADANVEHFTLDLEASELVVGLPGGVEATVELGLGEGDPLAGRAAVYLDQNHWSTMAAWRYGHKPINREGEEEAASRLAEMVRDGRIVLPMSAGHMVETTAMHDVPRQHLASTIIEFSRGWQMESPLHVRRAELAGALRDESLRAPGVISLGHDRLLVNRLRQPDSRDIPAVAAAAFPRAVNASSIYDMLLDPARIENDEGRAKADHWAQVHADLTANVARDGLPRERIATVAHGAVLTDLAHELVIIEGPERAIEWTEESAGGDLVAMPFLGRYRGVIGKRLGEPRAPWKRTDLNDLMYLSCAAGYADVVVGERRTISDLASLRAVTDGAVLTNSLADAVAAIESGT